MLQIAWPGHVIDTLIKLTTKSERLEAVGQACRLEALVELFAKCQVLQMVRSRNMRQTLVSKL